MDLNDTIVHALRYFVFQAELNSSTEDRKRRLIRQMRYSAAKLFEDAEKEHPPQKVNDG